MAINGVNGNTAYIGSAIVNLRNQLNNLTQQLASGQVATTYAGQGTDRGFALSLRAQVSSIDAFSDTATNVNTRLSVVNLALQGMSDIGQSVKAAAASSTIVLNNNGQSSGQITAQAAFANAISLLNSQSGDRYLFSGRASDTPATVSADVMLNGSGGQAGLKQLIDERRQADQGIGTMGHLSLEMLRRKAGVMDLIHVPYRGGGPLAIDLLGHHLSAAFIATASGIEQETNSTPPAARSVRAVAAPVAGTQRIDCGEMPSACIRPASARCQLPPCPEPDATTLFGFALMCANSSFTVLNGESDFT